MKINPADCIQPLLIIISFYRSLLISIAIAILKHSVHQCTIQANILLPDAKNCFLFLFTYKQKVDKKEISKCWVKAVKGITQKSLLWIYLLVDVSNLLQISVCVFNPFSWNFSMISYLQPLLSLAWISFHNCRESFRNRNSNILFNFCWYLPNWILQWFHVSAQSVTKISWLAMRLKRKFAYLEVVSRMPGVQCMIG